MMSLENLCKEIAGYNWLPVEEAKKLFERSLAECLTEVFGKRVIVYLSEESLSIYRAVGGGGAEGLEPFPSCLLNRKVIRRCRYRLEAELQKRRVLIDCSYLKSLQGSVVRGVIDRVRDDGSLSVLFYIDELLNSREVTGTCPLSQQPPGKRGTYTTGTYLFFYVSKVRIVGREMRFRVHVLLSLASMRLPEILLKMKSGMAEIRCVRRVAGRICFLVARQRLPREAIAATAAELGERIKIRWESSAG